MDIFFPIFQAVATMFGIGIIGFFIIHRKVVHGDLFGMIVPLVVDVGLPCLVFSNIIMKFDSEKFFTLWKYPLYWGSQTIYFLLLSIIFAKLSKPETRREFSLSLFYQNGIFVPIIIISQVFGSSSNLLSELFIFTVFYPILFFNTYSLFFRDAKSKQKSGGLIFKDIFNSVLIATIFAVVIKITGFYKYLPQFVYSVFSEVGKITIPLIMIVVGGNIYLDILKKQKFLMVENIKFVLVKNFIFPFFTIVLLKFLNLGSDLSFILFLQSVVPPITAAPIFIKRAGGNETAGNQFLISSFIISLFTIPSFYLFYTSLIKF